MYFDVSGAAAYHDLVPSLLLAAAAASAPQPSFWPGALAATGGGLLFTVLGFLLYSDYRGARRWLLGMTDASLEGAALADSLRRFNTRVFFGGDPESFADYKANGMPFLLGGVFLAMGSVVLLVGLFMDIVLAITAL
jgi:hypothetical protein